MKRMLLASTIAALLLAGPAFADKDNGHGKGHGGYNTGVVGPMPGRHGDDHEHGDRKHGDRDGRDRDDHDRDERGPSWKAEGRHDNGRHLGQYKHWARGQRLPGTYLEQRYYVRQYRTYNLAPPPPGMVWVRPYANDRNFYLVQTATGLISQILGR